MARKKSTLEAALFISGRELSIQELCRILKTTPEIVDSMVNELISDYEKRGGPIKIIKLTDGYKMDVDNAYMGKVRRLAKETELSRGLLKTLSYIAYKQPVKQSEVVRTIGNRTYDYIKELKEKNFIRSEPKGRTRILTITEKFTAYFGANPEILNEPPEVVRARIKEKEAAEEQREMDKEQRDEKFGVETIQDAAEKKEAAKSTAEQKETRTE